MVDKNLPASLHHCISKESQLFPQLHSVRQSSQDQLIWNYSEHSREWHPNHLGNLPVRHPIAWQPSKD